MFGLFKRNKPAAAPSPATTMPPRERVDFIGNRVQRFAGPAVLEHAYVKARDRAAPTSAGSNPQPTATPLPQDGSGLLFAARRHLLS